ncbi:MAG TPA: Smr/MutS family protein [Polyangiaceae bacterium]|nr:Smr/MutS family protein [Polyangiaceae bacterium]
MARVEDDPDAAVPGDTSAEPVVVMPIEDSIDLHTFDPREIEDVVDSYLEAAWEKGFREVRVIHGRGKGVQRARIRAVLTRDARVQAFGDAPGHRGGWGATLVWLKPRS